MKYYWFIILICLSCFSYGQNNLNDSCKCSKILDNVSFFWKQDSLGTNGYRYLAYQKLEKCKMDTLKLSVLLEKLGKPNSIINSNVGVDYLYYYLDAAKLPAEADFPYACWHISFFFKKGDDKLDSIITGSQER